MPLVGPVMAAATGATLFTVVLTMITAVLTIHGVVTESFANNSSLGYNVIVGAKGGKLQLTLNTVYYLSQPVENLPYDVYLEFLEAEQRSAEYAENSLKNAGLEAQLGPLAAAYVLLLAMLGPILARTVEPLMAYARRHRRMMVEA